MKATQGFTLIELLIVIAIIGVLASVLIPNLLGARTRANDTVSKTYLSDAVKFQEIAQIDTQTYAVSDTALRTLGLKTAPTGVTLTVVAANSIGYCMSSTHANGTPISATAKRTWYATAAGGIVTTACTAAG